MNLYYCECMSPYGRLGEYCLGRNRADAEREFHAVHGLWPSFVRMERKAK